MSLPYGETTMRFPAARRRGSSSRRSGVGPRKPPSKKHETRSACRRTQMNAEYGRRKRSAEMRGGSSATARSKSDRRLIGNEGQTRVVLS
jgi:hypothetical protein